MVTPQTLLNRQDAIGRSLEKSGHTLALIGLGSVGIELERLDAYSDLDFFAVVDDSYKLPRSVQGYERSRESALAILEFLEKHFEVNPALAGEIRRLAAE